MVKSKIFLYMFFLLVQIYKISLIFAIIYIIMAIILAGCRSIFTLPRQASRIYKKIKKIVLEPKYSETSGLFA